METITKIVFVILGIAFGVLQFFLTKRAVDAITVKKIKKTVLHALLKLGLYLSLILFIFFRMPEQLPFCGAGFAAGMIAGAFINFILSMNKAKSNEKGDDTP